MFGNRNSRNLWGQKALNTSRQVKENKRTDD